MTMLSETVLAGDCRKVTPAHAPLDLILADPHHGDTSLAWDRRVDGWIALAREALQPTGSLWIAERVRARIAAVLPLHGGGGA